jgi:hypothetical protein
MLMEADVPFAKGLQDATRRLADFKIDVECRAPAGITGLSSSWSSSMFEPHRAEAVMKKRITYSMAYRAAVEAAARQR